VPAVALRFRDESTFDRIEIASKIPATIANPWQWNRPTPSSVFDSRFLFGWSPV
jgi:hypothetical protein